LGSERRVREKAASGLGRKEKQGKKGGRGRGGGAGGERTDGWLKVG